VPWPLDTSRPADRFARLQSALADRYRLERELGRTGSVTGYLARDLASDRPVALKLIDPSATASAGSARLLRELRAAGRVQHHHLLPLLDAGVVRTGEGDAVYYTVRFLDGETLRARLARDGPVPVAEALAIAEDVAAALSAAHAQGVGHGALSPERVVLAGGEALLADLGVEAALQPEPPAPRDDLRDLGGVLYEMLSGSPPPAGPVPPLRAGRNGIPEEVELTVAQMLAPPADRYRTAEEALGALRSASAAARAASLPGTTTAERLAVRRSVPARWTVFTIAVLGLLGVSLWLRYSAPELAPPPPPLARPSSIAVLPFANATPDTANRYLSDGLTRELTAALGRTPGLRVAATASAFRLGRARLDPRRAGERLGVDVVLRGTLRAFEGRLRIRASLMSVREGFDLWSETYERDAADFAAVQREIVAAVAGTLRFRPAAADTAPVATAVRDVYLRAVQAGEAGDAGAAMALLEEVIRVDSSFAPAWAALATAWRRVLPDDSLGPAQVAGRARAAAERALALDSTLAEAHGVLGEVRFLHDWDWSAAEASLGRAVTLNPSLPLNHLRLAHLMLVVGRVDEALEAGRRALALSPFDPAVRIELARQSLQVGDYVRAEEYVQQALTLDPNVRGAELLRGLIAAVTGRYGDAVPPLERAAADSARAVEPLAMLGWVHALAGRREPARAIQAGLQEPVVGRHVSPYWLAFLAEALGDRRAAFAALDRAVAERAPELVDLRIDARMDRLRVDRRFDALARRIGLP
jgi:TolB-like protein/Tfp pilus assembly protein PilF